MKPTSNQTQGVKHAGAEVANLPPPKPAPAEPTATRAPVILGMACVPFVSQSPSPLTRMAAQNWIWIRPDIGAVIKIWNDGTWVWEHLSGTIEKQGVASGNEYAAAAEAEKALVGRAHAILKGKS